jgi:hypothetical protein
MQCHVPLLDAFGGQRTKRAHVLRQTDGNGDFRQLLRTLHAKYLQGRSRSGMGLGGTADEAERHRHLNGADEIALAIDFPIGERGVAAGARGPDMGAGLDGAPVIAGGDHHGIDTVHDALVVGRSAVGIDDRKRTGLDDAAGDPLAIIFLGLQRLRRHAPGAGDAQIGIVRQNAQTHGRRL